MKTHLGALRSLAEAPAQAAREVAAGPEPQPRWSSAVEKGRALGSLLRLLAVARQEVALLALGSVALLLSATVNVLVPYLVGYITDPARDMSLGRVLLIFVCVGAAGALCSFARAWLFTLAGERAVFRLRCALFECVMLQDMAFFDANRTGELVSRLSADTILLQVASTVSAALALRFFVQFVGSVAVLFALSWSLTLVMLAPLPLVGLTLALVSRTIRGLSVRLQLALARTAVVAEESISSARYVKTFGNEQKQVELYATRAGEALGLGRLMARALGLSQGVGELGAYLSVLAVVWYGSVLIDEGDLSQASFLSFILYTMLAAHAIGALSNHAADLMRAAGAGERVFALLDRGAAAASDAAAQAEAGVRPEPFYGRFELRDVVFAYPTRPSVPVLRGLSLTLEAGRSVALVGASGCGKSTVAQLLLRLYDLERPPAAEMAMSEMDGSNGEHEAAGAVRNSGCILLDGVPLDQVDAKWLRARIGFVAQEPVLFAASVRENIVYGRPGATQAEVETAARRAHIHDFIAALPRGYETEVGERGMTLSGGQKQRIAIARAILKDPAVLILDEPTSALDAKSERLVQQALDDLMRGRTVLVIAHRLSTIQRADLVAVMSAGRIAESGTHAELVERPQGVYRRLLAQQLRGGGGGGGGEEEEAAAEEAKKSEQ
jgi:ATP-binding cassette subfamily B protein